MSLLQEIISSVLILTGAAFMVIASIGLLRLPDFFIRNSASTKATTLGLGLILAGIGVHFNSIQVFLEVAAIIAFILLISPLAAHIIARAAYKTQVPFWKKTHLQDLEQGQHTEKPRK